MISQWMKKIIHKWLFSYTYELQILEGGNLPTKLLKSNVGYDLYVSRSTLIGAGQTAEIPTGIALKNKIPAWIYFVGNSIFSNHGLISYTGFIDNNVIGEIYIKVFNFSDEDFYVYPTMKLGQIIAMPYTTIKFNFTDALK